MKSITVLSFLLVAASIHAQLAVTVSPPQVTGAKAIVPLELKNNFNQGVASARAAVLLLDEQGKMVGQSAKWVIGGASQPATESKPGLVAGGTNAFNFVITATKPPHFLVIDYARPLNIAGVVYTARTGNENGRIKAYELYLSNDAKEWGDPVAKGEFNREPTEQVIKLPKPVVARYLKLVASSEQNGRPFATVAELEVIEAQSKVSQANVPKAKSTLN